MSMESGTLGAWLVKDGDKVTVGQPLYILETDKSESEIAAASDGVISLSGETGKLYNVGDTIGSIATE